MKHITYQNGALLNNYGHFYPVQGPVNYYVSEFIAYLTINVFGPILDRLGFRKDRNYYPRKQFKMGGSDFVQHVNIKQAIKYGTVLYIMVAVLAMPAGLCSHQQTTSLLSSKIVNFEMPAWSDILDNLAPAPAPKPETTVVVEAAQEQKNMPAPPFYEHVVQASQTYGVDAALIRAVIMAESSYNPRAVSHRGAQGLMQLMPRTAKWLGVKDSFNPAHNIDGGVRYLRQLLDRFGGDVKLALAAYNAGSRHVRNYGGVPPFKATRIYIKKVLKYRLEYQQEMVAAPSGITAS